MFHRKRWFILMPTLLLIPLLVGMVPMKLANKVARGGACAHSEGKQGCGGQKYCSAHSLISKNHSDAGTINPSSMDREFSYCQEALWTVSEPGSPGIQAHFVPLRC